MAVVSGRSGREVLLADIDRLRLGFVPQEQVRWFAPAQLSRTGLKVALSLAFADVSDKREMQAAMPSGAVDLGFDEAHDPDAVDGPGGEGPAEAWVDFVADLGDGFDSTFTVATLVAQQSLTVPSADGQAPPLTLPRGDVLVFGGDEIYPTPSAQGYDDRTKGPYRAALPEVAGVAPRLVAVPGNHDWYDGLTAFLRAFAQRRRVGAWRTVQTRSYFAARLPQGWWLVGLDSQFGGDIDEPQLAYFREHLSRRLQPGDAVIMCVASPTWVKAAGDPDAFDSMHYFDRTVVQWYREDNADPGRPTGASVRLWITGDSHHYARYEEVLPTVPDGGVLSVASGDAGGSGTAIGGPRQAVTCGLGGAYLSSTHHLPDDLELPPRDSRLRGRPAPTPDPPVPFHLAHRSPSLASSRAMRWGLLSLSARGFTRRNPGFLRVAGAGQAVFFVVLSALLGVQMHTGPMAAVMRGDLADVLVLTARTLVVALVGALSILVIRRRGPRTGARGPRRPLSFRLEVLGTQVALAFVGLAAAVGVAGAAQGLPWPGLWVPPGWLVYGLWSVVAFAVIGPVASYVFGVVLAVTRDPLAFDWQDSAQSLEDHKGFVRLHIDAEGVLRLYPVLAERIRRDWTARGGRLVPTEGLPDLRLIEPPVVIARTQAQALRPTTGGAPDVSGR